MADSEKQVSYGLSADASPFEAGLQRGSDAARNFAGNIDSQFKKVSDAFGAVQKQLLVLAGIVAGGAFFKDAIAASNNLTGETMKLSRALGINAEEAGTLRTALEDIGSSGDDYIATFTKFARQLRTNEDGLKSLGLQTRDANGNLRDSRTLFDEALGSVGKYKAGLDQNTYAQTLFGKSIDDVMKLQKLNNAVLEEAKRKNEELGLIVTKDNVEASKAYKLAMNDVGDVLLAVKKVIGDAVMPIFTELGQYFASTGPYVVDIFKGALTALMMVFRTVQAVVKSVAVVVFEFFNGVIDQLGNFGGLMAAVLKGLSTGDFSEAKGFWDKLLKRPGEAKERLTAELKDVWSTAIDDTSGDIERLWGAKIGAGAPKSGSGRMRDFKKSNSGADHSRTPQWEAELADQKLALQEQSNAAGTFYTMSKQQELAFWSNKLALTEKGSAENLAVRKKAAELQLGINQAAYQHEVAALQTQEANYKQNMDARLSLLDREADLVRQRYGAESKEYEDVQKKIVEAKRQAAEQLTQIDMIRTQSARNAALAEVQASEQAALLDRDLGAITTAQLLQLEQQFEDRRFQIQMEALRERIELAMKDPDRSPVELARMHAEIEELERQHQQRKSEIRNQEVRQATTASRAIANATAESMQTGLSKMMQGQLSFRGFMQATWQSVRAAVSDTLAKMLIDFFKNSVAMAAIKRALAIFDIGANAAQAGAGAAASAADTPVIGWLLAPVAAAATFAMASGYGSSVPAFSAAGGFDIPGTVNPLVQAHASEMILPAKYADVIRGMANGSQGPQSAAAPPVSIEFKATPLPGNFFMAHRDQLVKVLKSAQRDFVGR